MFMLVCIYSVRVSTNPYISVSLSVVEYLHGCHVKLPKHSNQLVNKEHTISTSLPSSVLSTHNSIETTYTKCRLGKAD